jgi:hypothetical protein
MRFADVDETEADRTSMIQVRLLQGGQLAPERSSRERPENQTNGLFAEFISDRDGLVAIERRQYKSGRTTAEPRTIMAMDPYRPDLQAAFQEDRDRNSGKETEEGGMEPAPGGDRPSRLIRWGTIPRMAFAHVDTSRNRKPTTAIRARVDARGCLLVSG